MSLIKTDAIQTLAGKPIVNSTGSVLQVVSTTKTDTFSTTSLLTDITGLSVAITPSASSSKILVMVQCHIVGTDAGLILQLVRGSTAIYQGDANGDRRRASMSGLYSPASSQNSYSGSGNHFHFLDAPSTTSATTYKVQGGIISGATAVIGALIYDINNVNAARTPSTITVMEIAG